MTSSIWKAKNTIKNSKSIFQNWLGKRVIAVYGDKCYIKNIGTISNHG